MSTVLETALARQEELDRRAVEPPPQPRAPGRFHSLCSRILGIEAVRSVLIVLGGLIALACVTFTALSLVFAYVFLWMLAAGTIGFLIMLGWGMKY